MKLFTDTVHKQIFVPKHYCSQIIDTACFQRLKHVEQTYASSIFPTATHNRFVHSLGVYHIGNLLFQAIESHNVQYTTSIKSVIEEENSKAYAIYCNDSKTRYEILKESFLVACLLHDCGHAPFSHTFEDYYTCHKDGGRKIRRDILQSSKIVLSTLNSDGGAENRYEQFTRDFNKHIRKDCKAVKPHEYVSAWLIFQKKGFYNCITQGKIYADPLLVARMIMGIPFHASKYISEELASLLNCYIGLLNGHLIDADRIDYASRDQWATGVSSSNFNLPRLLASIHIRKIKTESSSEKKRFAIVYNKKALTELQSLTETKNFSNYWVFNHHKFKLLEADLKRAVTCLAVLYNDEQETFDELIRKIQSFDIKHSSKEELDKLQSQRCAIENKALQSLFDYKTMISRKVLSFGAKKKPCREAVIFPTDDDIICGLKRYFAETESDSPLMQMGMSAYNDWFSRAKNYVPVWESYIEYDGVFQKRLKKHIEKLSISDNNDILILVDPQRFGDRFYRAAFDWIACQIISNNDETCHLCRKIPVEQSTIHSMRKFGSEVFVEIAGEFLELSQLPIPYKSNDAQYDPYFYLFLKKDVLTKSGVAPTTEHLRRLVLDKIEALTAKDIEEIISSYSTQADA